MMEKTDSFFNLTELLDLNKNVPCCSSHTMTSNCSFEEVDHLMTYLELVIYIPIFVSGLILNAIALFVFCFFLQKWTESTIYMTSLALMDLLLLFPLPFKMHATSNRWPAHLHPLCSVLESFYFIGIYGSIYTIMCIAADRWVAICHPFEAKLLRSPKAALGTCMGVWVLVLIAIIPIIYRFRDSGQTDFHCFHSFSEKGWSPPVIISLQVFGFLGPALVVVYCSVQTIWALQESGQHSPQSQACVKIIYSSLGAFLIPFTPSHLAILLQFLVHQGVIQDCSSKSSISLFIQITMCLSNITCCLDALCYYFIAHEAHNALFMICCLLKVFIREMSEEELHLQFPYQEKMRGFTDYYIITDMFRKGRQATGRLK